MARTQLNTRIEEQIAVQLEQLVQATNQPKAYHVQEALIRYLQEQSWQVTAIQEALADYRSGTADLVPHDDVMQRIDAILPPDHA